MSHALENTCQLEAILCCPECKGDLIFTQNLCECQACEKAYPIEGETYYFVPVNRAAEPHEFVDKVKSIARRWPSLYQFVVRVVSPVLPGSYYKAVLEQVEGCLVNIGSGNRSLGESAIDVDMFDYPNVSVVADIQELPFKEATVDGIISITVLEHVREPRRVIEECYRVLKDGGVIFTVVAFMQPFHASPADYQRYTKPGIEYLHREFELIDSGTYGGPVSGFLWIFQEFVALLLSFGIRPVRDLISMILMVLTWPIKLLDLLFRRLPTSTNLASTVFYYGKKTTQRIQKDPRSALNPDLK